MFGCKSQTFRPKQKRLQFSNILFLLKAGKTGSLVSDCRDVLPYFKNFL